MYYEDLIKCNKVNLIQYFGLFLLKYLTDVCPSIIIFFKFKFK